MSNDKLPNSLSQDEPLPDTGCAASETNCSVTEPSAPASKANAADTEVAAAKAADTELSLWDSLKVLFCASRAFWIVNLISFGDGIAYFGVLTLFTRFLGTDLHMPDANVSIAVSVFTGLVTLFMFGGGFVSDWLGVRKALLAALTVAALGRLMLVFCPELSDNGLYLAWAAIFVMALGVGVLEPALYAGVKEFTDPRTAAIGYGILYSIMNLGIVAENFISPFLRTKEVFLSLGSLQLHGLNWGIQGVYGLCAGITVLLVIITLCFLTKKVADRDRWHDVEAEKAQAKEKKEKTPLPFTDLRFIFFIFILLPVRTLFAHQWLTLPDYVFRCFPPEVGAKFEWIAGLNPLIIVIFVPLVAAFTRKMHVIDMMLIGTTVSALTTFILVPGPDVTTLILYVLLFSLGEALWSSRFLEYVAGLAPAGQVGSYMGLAGLPWFLAKFTTGLYSGFMLERFIPKGGVANSETLWLIYGCIALVSPIGLLLARKWLLNKEVKPASPAEA